MYKYYEYGIVTYFDFVEQGNSDKMPQKRSTVGEKDNRMRIGDLFKFGQQTRYKGKNNTVEKELTKKINELGTKTQICCYKYQKETKFVIHRQYDCLPQKIQDTLHNAINS